MPGAVKLPLTSGKSARLRAPGSLTIRRDGRDSEPGGAASPPPLNCRIDRLPGGRGPSPAVRREEEALVMSSATLIERAPSFRLPGVDGVEHSLEDYAGVEALVLIQSCNHCPYVQGWEGRMKAIQTDYSDRSVKLVAINSNDSLRYPQDSFDEMVRRAQKQEFNFDYLRDEDQSVARLLGPERTPEVFVFDRDRRLVYHGAIDDHRDEHAVEEHYLRDALDAVLEGREPPLAHTSPVGCSVKWRQ